jgi:hypothetical protein
MMDNFQNLVAILIIESLTLKNTEEKNTGSLYVCQTSIKHKDLKYTAFRMKVFFYLTFFSKVWVLQSVERERRF